jgi:hypothetical protein
MSAQQVLALGFGGLALVVSAAAFGATVMWRTVHLPSRPPDLPVWVSCLLVLSGVLWTVAAVLAGQWLLIASGVLISISSVIQLVQSLRHRSASGQ